MITLSKNSVNKSLLHNLSSAIGMLTAFNNVYAACDIIKEMGYGFCKAPDGGSMKGLAFAYDHDEYSMEIINRGGR